MFPGSTIPCDREPLSWGPPVGPLGQLVGFRKRRCHATICYKFISSHSVVGIGDHTNCLSFSRCCNGRRIDTFCAAKRPASLCQGRPFPEGNGRANVGDGGECL